MKYLIKIIFIFVILFLSPTQPRANSNNAWVCAINGLQIRTGPSTQSASIFTIPFGEKVNITKQMQETQLIGDEYGAWKQITWNNKQGWVFGGHLRTYDVTSLKKEAAEYFKNKYIKEFSTKVGIMKEAHMPLTKITPDDIKFQQVLQNIFVISSPVPKKLEPGVDTDNSIWFYQDNDWVLFEEYAGTVYLTYLNNDTIPEIITVTGCCINNDTTVYMKQKHEYKKIQFLDLSGQIEVMLKGKCNSAKIKHIPISAKTNTEYILYEFDCKKNSFVIQEKTLQ